MNTVMNSQIVVEKALGEINAQIHNGCENRWGVFINNFHKEGIIVRLGYVRSDGQRNIASKHFTLNKLVEDLDKLPIYNSADVSSVFIQQIIPISYSHNTEYEITLCLPEKHLLLDLKYIINNLNKLLLPLIQNYPEVFY